MLKEIASSLRWTVKLSKRLLSIYPHGIATAVVLSLLAQLALIASLLLPLKIVMIMSSGKIPSLLPSSLTSFGEQPLILGISVLAIGAFLFNNIANSFIERIATKGSIKLQATTNKLTLFESQDTIVKNAILRVSAVWASAIFFSMGLIILSQLYSLLAWVAIGFILLCLGFYTLIWERSSTLRHAVESKFGQHINMLGSIGFLVAFVAIVIDFMIRDIPSFLSILLSIILSRQILSQFATAIIGAHYLTTQQHKLKALAFDNHVLQPTVKKTTNTAWAFLENPEQRKALCRYIAECIKSSVELDELKWLDTGINNILHFTLITNDKECYLIKVFDKNKSAKARHEATLLLDPPKGLPSPPMIDAGSLNSFNIHIFDTSDYQLIEETIIQSHIQQLQKTLERVEPNEELVAQYQRSRPMLWDRIDERMLDRAFSIARNKEMLAIRKFKAHQATLKETMKSAPIVISKPLSSLEILYQSKTGNTVAINWTDWRIEPYLGESVGPKNEYLATYSVNSKQSTNKEIKTTLVNKYSQLEISLLRQKYNMALRIVCEIVDEQNFHI
ncbi:hypothetical protein DIT71_16975 [Marinobacter vulgaris]|uniref:Uncharacterized protein n=2 Tax=Marinobacter vulgaris TaxID=1928331 RepID=A0A2V3ZGY8_9GAMM|nr:hypothetical protein [Marinobacter vulgaris]PXX88881.1 hypothetical protein DIT71_16975 [Marinobacter vulgaris]